MKSLKKESKTLCILANTKVGDLYGHKILNCLKTNFLKDVDINLVGNGGEYLKKHGQKSIIDLNDLREKFLYLWRNTTKQYNNRKHSNAHMYQVCLRMNNNLLTLVNF